MSRSRDRGPGLGKKAGYQIVFGDYLLFGGLVYALYGAYQVYEGRDFRYLWVGDWIERRASEQPKTRSSRSAETDQSNKNVLLIVVVVLVVLVLCAFCALAGLIALGILGGIVAYDASAWLPALLYLV